MYSKLKIINIISEEISSLGAQVWNLVPTNLNVRNLLTNLIKIIENLLQRTALVKCMYKTYDLYEV